MRKTTFTIALASALSLGPAIEALAQDFDGALAARKGQMQIMSLNVGILGNMARERTEYDAELAQIAADNLVAISAMNNTPHFPEGSDNASIEDTRALPAIWENSEGFLMAWQGYGEAARGLQAVAGDGLDAMRAAIGPVGTSCGACHDDFRQPQ